MALIKLKRGFDLNLKGQIKQESVADDTVAQRYAVIPDDLALFLEWIRSQENMWQLVMCYITTKMTRRLRLHRQ